MKKITFISLVLMLNFYTTVETSAQNEVAGLSSVDSVERAKRHPIISERPAVSFFEGAVLGNGGLGAIVTTRPDAVVIYFGHNAVWDIRLAEDNKEKIGTFAEIYNKIIAIPDSVKNLTDDPWLRDYMLMARENYAKPYPRPFPCGSIVLWFDRRNAELTGHRLNIDSGICKIDFIIDGEPARLEVFTDINSDSLFAQMVDDSRRPIPSPFSYVLLRPDPKTPKELPSYTVSKNEPAGTIGFRQVLPFEEIKEKNTWRPHPKDKAFCLTARFSSALDNFQGRKKDAHPDGGPLIPGQKFAAGPLKGMIDGTRDFSMCIQLDHGMADDVKLDSSDASPPSAIQHKKVKQASVDVWTEYWNKSGIAFDDEFLEEIWYRNLYFLRCSVSPGVTCPGLFANWSYGGIGTAWHGDYHMNYNTQQPFWVTFSSNHTDLHMPYVDMVEHLILPVSKKWAEEYYNMRGAFFPHSAYPVEMTMMPYPVPTWGWEVFETPWTVQSIWWHYLYTKDRVFLEDRAFDIIKEAVLFLVDYMKRPEAHGSKWDDDKYHIYPSVPPELYGLQPGFDKNYDTIADLTLTRYVFNAFTKACKVLDCERKEKELLSDIREIMSHFPEYPTAKSQRGEVFVSVEGEDPEVVYNVPVSLMTVFPGDHHGLHSSPDEFEIAAATYRNQQNEGGNEIVFLNVQAARLGLLNIEKFKRQVRYSLLPNGTCNDKVLQIHGRYSNNTPFDYMGAMGIWFENFALPLVINECLLQSYNGDLRFFPNWNMDENVEFRSLRAVGAFLVSAKIHDGVILWIEIVSEAGGELSIISPWENGAVVTQSGKDRALKGEKFSIATTSGERILLKPAQ